MKLDEEAVDKSFPSQDSGGRQQVALDYPESRRSSKKLLY